MIAATGHEAPDCLQIPQLIKHLCLLQTKRELERVSHLPTVREKLIKSQLNVAYDLLLGLRPEDAPQVNDLDDLEILVPRALVAVQAELRREAFPELAVALDSGLSCLDICTSCAVVSNPGIHELTRHSLVVPFPNRTALLAFLLRLQGSAASVRRRQVTFQQRWRRHWETLPSPSGGSVAFSDTSGGPALRSDIFQEAPDPDALFAVSSTTSVLLPSECGVPSSSVAAATITAACASPASMAAESGTRVVENLDACFGARPIWAPTSSQNMLALESTAGWLPISESLAKGLTRTTEDGIRDSSGSARATGRLPLGIPLNALAADASPGSIAAFQELGNSLPTGMRVLSPPAKPGLGGGGGAFRRRDSPQKPIDSADVHLESSPSLHRWSEDEELARDAVLALQGVRSALLRLRGVLAAPCAALSRPASAGLLRSVERTATLRQRLENFVATYGITTMPRGDCLESERSISNLDPAGFKSGRGDTVLQAFACAVHDILRCLTQDLSQISEDYSSGKDEESSATSIKNRAVLGAGGICIFRPQGPSLLSITTATKRAQALIRSLATLCWCSESMQQGELCGWEITEPPFGTDLLEYLLKLERQAAADPFGQYQRTLQYLFARAAHPYIASLHMWVFSTMPFGLRDPYVVQAGPESIDLSPPPPPPDDVKQLSASTKRPRRVSNVVPGPLPRFLAHWEHAVMHSGVQLRLLQSIDYAQELVTKLVSLNMSRSAPQKGSRYVDQGHWLTLRQTETIMATDTMDAELLITSVQAQNALLDSANDDAARNAAVDEWLLSSTEKRQQEALLTEADALAVVRRLQGEREAADTLKAGVLERNRLDKAALLEEQRDAIAVSRVTKIQATLKLQKKGDSPSFPGHTSAIMEEELTSSSSPPISEGIGGGAGAEGPGASCPNEYMVQDNDVNNHNAPLLDATGDGSCRVSCLWGARTSAPFFESPDEGAAEGDPPSAATEALAPLPLALEAMFGRAVESQARAVSRACVGFFIDHLGLLRHLSFLRLTFFMAAGDWADEFLMPLVDRVAGLRPLDGHSMHGILQDSLRMTSLDQHPFAPSLLVDLLPGPTAASTFLSSLITEFPKGEDIATEKKDRRGGVSMRSLPQLPKGRAVAPLLVAPARVDGIDCVLLRYKVDWPLAAVLTEDTAVGYAAVFNAIARVRRVGILLRKLQRETLLGDFLGVSFPRTSGFPMPTPAPKEGSYSLNLDGGGVFGSGAMALAAAEALTLPSETVAFEASQHNLQKLRVYVHTAAHFVSAVQAFHGVCASSAGWTTMSTALAAPTAYDRSKNSPEGCEEDQRNSSIRRPENIQEIVDMHREYVRDIASNCLTYCGNAAVAEAVDTALGAVLEMVSLAKAAVTEGGHDNAVPGIAAVHHQQRRRGGTTFLASSSNAWSRTLADVGTWNRIEASFGLFSGAYRRLGAALARAREGGSRSGPLNDLEALLHPR